MPIILENAAGGVVFKCKRRVTTLIVSLEEGQWTFPKGLLEANESAERASLREVHEECGIEAAIEEPLDSVSYTYTSSSGVRHKTVEYFKMRFLSGRLKPQLGELLDVRWVSIARATHLLTFAADREILSLALKFISYPR